MASTGASDQGIRSATAAIAPATTPRTAVVTGPEAFRVADCRAAGAFRAAVRGAALARFGPAALLADVAARLLLAPDFAPGRDADVLLARLAAGFAAALFDDVRLAADRLPAVFFAAVRFATSAS